MNATQNPTDTGAHAAVYLYRHGDRLTRVDSTFPDESALIQYVSDGLGTLREKVVNSTDVTWYRWDAAYHMIAQYDDPDTDWAPEGLQYTFPHDPSRLFGTALAADAGADPATGAYRYFLQDAYGSTRQLRLQDKSLAGAWEYRPYGDLYHGGGTESVFAYTGQLYDANAGLHYFPFRYYNPALARWLTPEPTGADGPNLYWYGIGNPASLIDLYGLWTFSFILNISGGFGIGGGMTFGVDVDGHGGVSGTIQGQIRGYGGVGGSAGFGGSWTNADTVGELNGSGAAAGGSVGWGPSFGGEFVTGPSGYWGGTGLIGVGAGVEVHGEYTYTVPVICFHGCCT